MADAPKLLLEDIPVMNLGQFILNDMAKHEEKVAMVEADTDMSMTFSQLIDRVKRVAAGLQKLGVRKDDVICMMSPNNMDYIVLCYASALIYATFQPINALYTADDMRKAFRQCDTKYMVTTPALLKKTEEAVEEFESIKVIVCGDADGYMTFESLADPKHGEYVTPEADPKTTTAALLSSSGTTGFPKPVQLSHFSLVAMNLQQRSSADFGSCAVSFLPMFHIFGLYITTMAGHSTGGKVIIMSRFIPDQYLALIQKYKPPTLQVVPPVMVLFSKYPKLSEYDLSSVGTIYCGAAPLSQEIEDIVKGKLNLECIHQGFGMTEVGVTHVNTNEEHRRKSVGRLLPLVELQVVDVETRKVLGTNEEGELLIRGPQICSGYLNLPEENDNLFTNDGWVKTGDIGRVDEDGYLFVVDRLKQLIKYKGFQVAPATLEDILLSHSDVADVGVVGMPDLEAGELPRAYVVKKAGSTITEDDIITYVNGRVAPHMKLRGGVKFIDTIPRTASGKILRRTLKEDAKALAAELKTSV